MANKLTHHILGYLIGGVIFLLGLPYGLYLVSHSFDHYLGVLMLPFVEVRIIIAAILLLLGLWFAVWSLVIQNRIGKGGPLEAVNVEISPKTEHLVVTGPYKYTRNPMLFGTCMYYYALAIFFNSFASLAGAVLFMALMLILVKFTEEKRLLKEFGDDYIAYRQKVPMFIPGPPK